MTNQFDEAYFMDGIRSGKSNYVSYQWMPERSLSFAKALIDTLGIKRDESCLDLGCARGYAVKALRRLGVNAVGFDTSEWAIKNCDPEVEKYVSTAMPPQADYVLAKDVFEHVPIDELRAYIKWIFGHCEKAALIMVPLSPAYGQKYVREEDEKDATHIHRWSLNEWMEIFHTHSNQKWSVSGSWHIEGLKPTSWSHPRSCGFITLRKTTPE